MRELVTTDAEIAALATRQYGVVAARQLELSANAMASRTSSGRLFRVHRGVYAVGHLGLGQEARWLAAVLACGDGRS
jgi:predicted transcriptional regulator of viral defense system